MPHCNSPCDGRTCAYEEGSTLELLQTQSASPSGVQPTWYGITQDAYELLEEALAADFEDKSLPIVDRVLRALLVLDCAEADVEGCLEVYLVFRDARTRHARFAMALAVSNALGEVTPDELAYVNFAADGSDQALYLAVREVIASVYQQACVGGIVNEDCLGDVGSPVDIFNEILRLINDNPDLDLPAVILPPVEDAFAAPEAAQEVDPTTGGSAEPPPIIPGAGSSAPPRNSALGNLVGAIRDLNKDLNKRRGGSFTPGFDFATLMPREGDELDPTGNTPASKQPDPVVEPQSLHPFPDPEQIEMPAPDVGQFVYVVRNFPLAGDTKYTEWKAGKRRTRFKRVYPSTKTTLKKTRPRTWAALEVAFQTFQYEKGASDPFNGVRMSAGSGWIAATKRDFREAYFASLPGFREDNERRYRTGVGTDDMRAYVIGRSRYNRFLSALATEVFDGDKSKLGTLGNRYPSYPARDAATAAPGIVEVPNVNFRGRNQIPLLLGGEVPAFVELDLYKAFRAAAYANRANWQRAFNLGGGNAGALRQAITAWLRSVKQGTNTWFETFLIVPPPPVMPVSTAPVQTAAEQTQTQMLAMSSLPSVGEQQANAANVVRQARSLIGKRNASFLGRIFKRAPKARLVSDDKEGSLASSSYGQAPAVMVYQAQGMSPFDKASSVKGLSKKDKKLAQELADLRNEARQLSSACSASPWRLDICIQSAYLVLKVKSLIEKINDEAKDPKGVVDAAAKMTVQTNEDVQQALADDEEESAAEKLISWFAGLMPDDGYTGEAMDGAVQMQTQAQSAEGKTLGEGVSEGLGRLGRAAVILAGLMGLMGLAALYIISTIVRDPEVQQTSRSVAGNVTDFYGRAIEGAPAIIESAMPVKTAVASIPDIFGGGDD